jgi:hypothetical protein
MGPPTPITTSQRVLRDRIDEARQLYRVYDAPSGADHRQERRGTLGAGGWCDMPRTGARRFLVMDAGPVYSRSGPLFGILETWRDMTVQNATRCPCCCWTLITSSRTTTPTATPPATNASSA